MLDLQTGKGIRPVISCKPFNVLPLWKLRAEPPLPPMSSEFQTALSPMPSEFPRVHTLFQKQLSRTLQEFFQDSNSH